MARFLADTLAGMDQMPECTIAEIVEKYGEMNVAHPFMEGNGRSTQIWLDLILKRSLKKWIDWSRIGKSEYMNAMVQSSVDSSGLKQLL